MAGLKVALIFGGCSSEHEVSIRSARSIYAGLNSNGHEVIPFAIARNGSWLAPEASKNILEDVGILAAEGAGKGSALSTFIIMAEGQQGSKKFDAIFPVVHGTCGEDGALQGLFKLLNLPFVAPDVLGSAICMDKDVAKRLLMAAGIDCAPFVCIRSHEISKANPKDIIKNLNLPLFVKPANQGSSVGISKVSKEEELLPAIKYAANFDKKIIVEKFIKGREIECSVMGNENPEASNPGEILPEEEFYSYEAKYSAHSKTKTKNAAELPTSLKELIRESAIKSYRILECEGMARVDFFVEESGRIWLNEINTIPGFTSISMYPKMWEASGVSFSTLLDKLIHFARERHTRDNTLKLSPG